MDLQTICKQTGSKTAFAVIKTEKQSSCNKLKSSDLDSNPLKQVKIRKEYFPTTDQKVSGLNPDGVTKLLSLRHRTPQINDLRGFLISDPPIYDQFSPDFGSPLFHQTLYVSPEFEKI